MNPDNWILCSCKWSLGVKYADFVRSCTNLHHSFVRVHELNGSVYSVDTALQICGNEKK